MNHNEALEILKRALSACTLTQLGKRVETYLQNQIGERGDNSGDTFYPYVSVWVGKQSHESSVIRFWYDRAKSTEVRVYTKSLTGEEPRDWRKNALEDIERQFSYDYDQRAEQEAKHIDTFKHIEEQIKVLQAQARKIIEDMPVPARATIRNDKSFWMHPSAELRKRFPLSFGE